MKALITVASRHNSTRELGQAVGRVLEAEGVDVDVLEPEEVTTVEPYDVVVLGSAVYVGRWLEPARDLVERELDHLLQRKVWLFSSGPIGNPAKPRMVSPDALDIRERLHAIDHQVFEGRLDRAVLGLGEKVIASAVGAAAGDYRPWDVVLDWARGIARELHASEVPVALGGAVG